MGSVISCSVALAPIAFTLYKLKEAALAGSPANNFTVIVSALLVSSDTYNDLDWITDG